MEPVCVPYRGDGDIAGPIIAEVGDGMPPGICPAPPPPPPAPPPPPPPPLLYAAAAAAEDAEGRRWPGCCEDAPGRIVSWRGPRGGLALRACGG